MINLIRIAARIASGNGDACIYVDLDETLIHTIYLKNNISVSIFNEYPGEKFQYEKYGAMLRPGANEFLASLRELEIGPIYLLTHSMASYAETMVAAFGLDVDAIFPRESLIGGVGRGEKKFILVDDLDPLHPIFQMKAISCGIPLLTDDLDEDARRAYFSAWQIRPPVFLGDPSDRGLEGMVEAVATAFGVAS